MPPGPRRCLANLFDISRFRIVLLGLPPIYPAAPSAHAQAPPRMCSVGCAPHLRNHTPRVFPYNCPDYAVRYSGVRSRLLRSPRLLCYLSPVSTRRGSSSAKDRPYMCGGNLGSCLHLAAACDLSLSYRSHRPRSQPRHHRSATLRTL